MTPSATKYTAQIDGSSWAKGPTATFASISEAQAWAEEFGSTADCCSIYQGERLVALYVRSINGNGHYWYKGSAI